jgi:outer membrane biosynthesis protein TonB
MAEGSDDDSPDEIPDDLPEELRDVKPEEGPILSPEELDIRNSEYVEEIEEGRFVVSPHERPPKTPKKSQEPEPNQSRTESQPADEHATPRSQPESEPQETAPPPQPQQPQQSHQQPQQPTPVGQQGELTQERVHQWLRTDFEQSSSRYAFDVTATFDGTVSQRRMASNDVVTIFESLMLWYAQQVDNDTPVEEILGILLMESNVPVRYPAKSVKNLVKSAGLGPNDSIGDLLEAIQDDGVKL